MSHLGPEAQKLIQAGRSALRPTVADRERIAAALRARGGPSPAPALFQSSGLGGAKLAGIVVGLGAASLLVAGALHRAPAETLASPPSASVSALLAAPVVSVHAPDAPVPLPAVEQSQAVEEKRSRTRSRPDRLAEEVEILSRAQKEIHAGRFAGALELLEQHARVFPRGTLAPERRAARVQALCALDQRTEADVELARLAPGSLHESRAREACATPASTRVR